MAADGVGCSELSKLGWQAIKAMKDAGYSVVGDNSSWVADVTSSRQKFCRNFIH